MTGINIKLRKLSLWHFLWFSVAASEALTSLMSLVLKGKITYDYLVTGGIVSLAVSSIVLYLVGKVRKTEDSLNEALRLTVIERDRAKKYLDIAGAILVIIGADGKVRLINKKGLEILGRPEAGVIGRNWFDNFLPENIRVETKSVFMKLMAGDITPVEYHENPVITAGGEERLIAWHNALLTGDGGDIIGSLSSGEDITERKRLEKRLEEASITDELTGLFNRRGFFNYAEQQFHIARRSGKKISIYFLDVDKLKDINDRYGHKEGDNALIETSEILRGVFRKSDVIARMGGDEFSVLMTCTQIDSLDAMEKRLQGALDYFNKEGKYPFKLSVSIGAIQHDPEVPIEMDYLLNVADKMMFERKKGKKRYGETG